MIKLGDYVKTRCGDVFIITKVNTYIDYLYSGKLIERRGHQNTFQDSIGTWTKAKEFLKGNIHDFDIIAYGKPKLYDTVKIKRNDTILTYIYLALDDTSLWFEELIYNNEDIKNFENERWNKIVK